MKLNQKQLQQLKSSGLTRTATITKAAIDEEKRTVEVAFSSEDPYERYFGFEILGHARGEVEMDWLSSGTAPVLDQHNHSKQIGVIESARIDADGVGRAVVRFPRSSYAEEFFQDVVDGIRQNISVGYFVHEMKLVEESDDVDTYRVTRWESFEVSFVSVPADKTVGVGRSADDFIQTRKGEEMDPKEKKTEEPVKVDVKQVTTDTRNAELGRIKEITALGAAHNMVEKANEFILNDKPVEDFRSFILDELAKKGIKPVETKDPEIGLGKKEVEKFSFLKAINYLANPASAKARENAAFELEASEAVQSKLKCSAKGVMVPFDVLNRAGQTVGTDSAGGNLVATTLAAGSFIDLLRNAMMMVKMGIRTIDGLVGDIAIPKLISGYSAYWVDEGGDPTESAAVFGQVALTPKTVGARTELSRKFILQSSIGAENFARLELALALALEADRVIINGSGTSPEPRGILNTTGIGAVECGTNGGVLTWAKVVELWSEVALDNAAIGNTGYVTNTPVAGKLMTTEKATGTAQFIIKDFPDSEGFMNLAGSRCAVTNQVPSDLDKGTSTGVCSAAIFGNFADVVVGHWGTLDLTIDPYSKAESGTVRVIALQDMDVAIRRAESFAAAKDILTA